MELAGRVNGNDGQGGGLGDGGLQKVWDDMGLGVGGRVRALVLERLRANSSEGVVGRWQEVCCSLFIHINILTMGYLGESSEANDDTGSSNNGSTLLRPCLNL